MLHVTQQIRLKRNHFSFLCFTVLNFVSLLYTLPSFSITNENTCTLITLSFKAYRSRDAPTV